MGLVRVKLKSNGSTPVLDAGAAYTLIKLGAATYIEGTLPTEVPVETTGFGQAKRLIAIITCHGRKFLEQAESQRLTWVPECAKYGFDVRFFLGKSERPAREDEIYLDVDDGYAGLPAKVRAMFAWSVEHGYDYTLKTDDDVYIIPYRLDKAPVAPHDFVGRFRVPSGGYPAEYASGFAYWLSKKAAGHVANAPLNPDWAEDRYVANALAIEGIFGMSDWISYVAPAPPLAPDVIIRCGISAATVFCQFNAKEMGRMHLLFKSRPAMFSPPTLREAPRRPCTLEQLMKPCQDKIPNRLGG
ncbi:Galactosyltransferase [uncultured archaeon]|nr:Galactosyltransferase [uncultured archaeon]